jgi:hypothetical protein
MTVSGSGGPANVTTRGFTVANTKIKPAAKVVAKAKKPKVSAAKPTPRPARSAVRMVRPSGMQARSR